MRRFVRFFFLILAAAVWLGGCAHVYTAHGAYYRVKDGDTLAGVAQRYRIDVQDLAEVNNIESSSELRPGSALYIPGLTPNRLATLLKKEAQGARTVAKKEREKERKRAEKEEKTKSEKGEKVAAESEEEGVKTDRGRFVWPVEGEVSSLFGMRHGRRHDGLDISAKMGTPVYASADGEVVYAKKMRGYGNLILLKHKDDFFTVYAHNSVNLVKVGTKVKKGQMVSRIGRTGRATGPHLHFEVREGPKARNPLFFLPKNRYAEKAKELKDDAPSLESEEGEPEPAEPPAVADNTPGDSAEAPEPPAPAVDSEPAEKPKSVTAAKAKKTGTAHKKARKTAGSAAPAKTAKKAKVAKATKSTKAPKTTKAAVKPAGGKKSGKTEAKNP